MGELTHRDMTDDNISQYRRLSRLHVISSRERTNENTLKKVKQKINKIKAESSRLCVGFGGKVRARPSHTFSMRLENSCQKFHNMCERRLEKEIEREKDISFAEMLKFFNRFA